MAPESVVVGYRSSSGWHSGPQAAVYTRTADGCLIPESGHCGRLNVDAHAHRKASYQSGDGKCG